MKNEIVHGELMNDILELEQSTKTMFNGFVLTTERLPTIVPLRQVDVLMLNDGGRFPNLGMFTYYNENDYRWYLYNSDDDSMYVADYIPKYWCEIILP